MSLSRSKTESGSRLTGVPPAKKLSEEALLSVLEDPKAELKAKMDACRELARVGTAKAVPALAKLLGREKLSHMARYALEPIPDAAADEALREAAGKLEGRHLAGVAASIGVRRDARAVPVLIRLLENPDPDVAAAAARSLGRIATPEAVEALAQRMASAPEKIRLAVADACIECAERLAAAGRRREARPLLQAVRQAQVPEYVRAAARLKPRGARRAQARREPKANEAER